MKMCCERSMRIPRNFNIRSLEIFVAVVRCKDMKTTAEKIGISQSTVTQCIANLETSTKAKLFDRTTRPMRLTHQGQYLFKRAEMILSLSVGTIRGCMSLDFGPIDTLTVAMLDSVLCTAGPDIVRELSKLTNHLTITSGFSTDHSRCLQDRRVDVVISSDEGVVEEPTFASLPILCEPYMAVVPRGADINIDDMENCLGPLPLIKLPRRSADGFKLEQHLCRMGMLRDAG